MKNQDAGWWILDTIKDNFWTMVALWYSAPPTVTSQASNSLEYLFNDCDSTVNLDLDIVSHDELYSTIEDLSDNLSDNLSDCHTDSDNFGFDDFYSIDYDF